MVYSFTKQLGRARYVSRSGLVYYSYVADDGVSVMAVTDGRVFSGVKEWVDHVEASSHVCDI
jgi:hypothetical protein